MVARTLAGPTRWSRFFWRGAPATLAFRALRVEFVIGAGVFLVTLPFATMTNGGSVVAAIFGPAVGMPLVAWLGLVAVVLIIEAIVVFALRASAAWARALGSLMAFLSAAFCVLWVTMIALEIVLEAANGFTRDPSQLADIFGALLFVPIAGVIAVLNGRAAFVELQILRGRALAT